MTTRYTMSPTVPLTVDGAFAPYVWTIRDLPDDERPRERLIKHGPGVLSTHELLAVILNVGTQHEDVLSMASRIVKEYGERSIFAQLDAKTLAEDLGIPLGKALQIVAVGELGRRYFLREREGAVVVRTAKDVFEYVADMRSLPKEHLRGLYVNAHYQIIRDEVISIGTVDANIIHPREIFRPAIAASAVGVILVHNHPSGVLEASAQDRAVTNQIVQAGTLIGIELVDHVIVTSDGFMSIMRDYLAYQ